MKSTVEKTNKNNNLGNEVLQTKGNDFNTDFVSNRQETGLQTKLQSMADESPQVKRAAFFQNLVNQSFQAPVQPKLKIGDANDSYEQEADRTADQIMKMPTLNTNVQKKHSNTNIPLQRKFDYLQRKSGGAFKTDNSFESDLNSSKGSGTKLPENVQNELGSKFGTDFSNVKIHNDSNASNLTQQIQAKAFTTGNDIYFNSGQYNPESTQGKHLLAHELTHTIQQGANSPAVNRKPLNDAVSFKRNPQPVINRMPENTIQRMMTKEAFYDSTNEGTFSRRPPELKEIDTLLIQYAKTDPTNFSECLAIIQEIHDMVSIWITDHIDDKSTPKRTAGMYAFEQHLLAEKVNIGEKQKEGPASAEEKPVSFQRSKRSDQIREKHEGTASSMFSKLGFLIDMAVPNEGDKSTLEIEFKIPVAPAAFIGGHLKAEAERGEQVKVRTELTLTGGVSIGIAEIKGEIGGYLEAQASTSEKVLTLLSYAFYKRISESPIVPQAIANYMWGGETGSAGAKRAEKWAGAIENDILGTEEEAYVETGGIVGASAKVGVEGLGEVEAKASATAGTRYDKASVETNKAAGNKKMGRSMYGAKVSAALEAGPFKGEGEGKFFWKGDDNNKLATAKTPSNWELEASFQAKIPFSTLIAGGLGKILPPLISSISGLANKVDANKDKTKGQSAGNLADFAGGAIHQIQNIEPEMDMEFEVPEETTETTFEGTSALKLVFSLAGEGKKVTEGGLGLDHVKTMGVPLPGDMFKAELEKASSILKIAYSGGGWVLSGKGFKFDLKKAVAEEPAKPEV